MKPKKERPSALPDSIFQARLGQASNELGHVPEEIPVHNTFIQFGAPPSSGSHQKPVPTTAPAWIGPSFQSIIQQASTETPKPQAPVEEPLIPSIDTAEPFFAPEDEESPQERLPLGSPQKVPMMRYALSSSSARAAGLPEWSPKPVGGQDDEALSTGAIARAAALGPIGSPLGSPGSAAAPAGLPSPTQPGGPLPSMGSAMHAEGSCKRCCFFPKGRCQNGLNCEFCHFEHEKRKRKKKKKGAGAKRDGNADDSGSDEDSNNGQEGMQQNSGYEQSGFGFSPLGDASMPWAQSDTLSWGGSPGHGVDPLASSRAAALAAAGSDYAAAAPGAWSSQNDPLGSLARGLPLTAPPMLPPRGLPVPTEPPPPAPIPVNASGLQAGAEPYYPGGGYDLGAPSGGSPYAPGILGGYGGAPYGRSADGRPSGLGGVGINQSYFGGGYDPAAIAAQQQQQAAYTQQPQGRCLPPPR